MSKYRNNSMDPRTLTTLAVAGHVGFKVAEIVNVQFNRLTSDEYDAWVKDWKSVYAALTLIVREMRKTTDFPQSEIHVGLHHMRVLSNTMLNARQYARDSRRGLPREA